MNLLVDRKAQDVNINVVLLGGAVTLARVYLFFFIVNTVEERCFTCMTLLIEQKTY